MALHFIYNEHAPPFFLIQWHFLRILRNDKGIIGLRKLQSRFVAVIYTTDNF